MKKKKNSPQKVSRSRVFAKVEEDNPSTKRIRSKHRSIANETKERKRREPHGKPRAPNKTLKRYTQQCPDEITRTLPK